MAPQNMIIKWMRSLFSDVRSAIVSTIVGVLVTGTGSIYLFYKNLWHSLMSTMLSQTPLWATISLVLVALVYTYLKTEKSNQSTTAPPVLNLKGYDYVEDPGYYVHNVTKAKYCGNCIDKHDRLHRLSFDYKKGLICRPCGNSYVSPSDYKSTWKQETIDT